MSTAATARGKRGSAETSETRPKSKRKAMKRDAEASCSPGNMVPFFGKTSPFSQFHACTFTDPRDQVTYNCCEQFMMAQKATLFGDQKALEEIMAASSPSIQKRWGRKVRGFQDDEWKRHRLTLVTCGNLLKFSQNPALAEALLATGDKIIVEACRDGIWGSGKPSSHPKAFDQTSWGLNLLGTALMAVREMLSGKGTYFNFVESNPDFVLNAKAQGDIIRARSALESLYPSLIPGSVSGASPSAASPGPTEPLDGPAQIADSETSARMPVAGAELRENE